MMLARQSPDDAVDWQIERWRSHRLRVALTRYGVRRYAA